MIDLLALSSLTTGIVVGAVVLVGAQMAWMMKTLKSVNTDPDAGDERKGLPGAHAAEADNSYQTQVAAPRARKLQAAARTQSLSSALPAAEAEKTEVPIQTTVSLPKESELAEPVLASAETAPAAKEFTPPADAPTKSETPVPAGALVLEAKAPEITPESKDTREAASEKPVVPSTALPPLAVTGPGSSLPTPAARPSEVPTPARKFFGPSNPAVALTASANPPGGPGDKKEDAAALPSLSSVLPSLPGELKKGASAAGTPKPESEKAAPASETPKVEKAGDGLIAVGAPVEITGKDESTPAAGDEDDDVKKKKNRPPTPAPAPATSGLILMPAAEAKAEPAEAKAAEVPAATEKAAAAVEEKPAEPVLSPTAADTTPAAKPEEVAKPEAEAKPAKGPRVFLPGRFFGRGKEKETVKIPEPILAKTEEPAAPKITEPAVAPALVTPPVEETAAKPEAKEEPKDAAPEAPKPVESGKAGKEEPAARDEGKEPAPKAPESKEPVAPKGEAPKEEKTEPVPVPTLPKGDSAPERASLVTTSQTAPAADSKAKEEPSLPTQAAPATAPVAEPIVPVIMPAAAKPAAAEAPASAETAVPVPTVSTGTPAAPSKPEPAATVSNLSKTQPTMPPTDEKASSTTTTLPNAGRASAQLTIAFEVTSLQLTPFFKLGGVQLKALSNVVSLHLLAAQADNPLAAGISFQIDRVELDGSEHLKSILLKPLGESRTMAAPLPKLQVDSVAVSGGGSEHAPIAVTTSSQASTAVQLFGNFTIASMEFTPAFEIGSLRLEPTSNTVLLRVAPSNRPTALDLPPSFEVAAVQLVDGGQIGGMRLTPGGKAS